MDGFLGNLARITGDKSLLPKEQPSSDSKAQAVINGAKELGIDPLDYATVISYETGGTFDPWQKGPITKWGQHRGTIQYGEPQAAKYGVHPGQSFDDQVEDSNVRYLRDRGVRPGADLMTIYKAINGGSVNASENASDRKDANGKPITIADHVRDMMGAHRQKAQQFLGGNYQSDSQVSQPNSFLDNLDSVSSDDKTPKSGFLDNLQNIVSDNPNTPAIKPLISPQAPKPSPSIPSLPSPTVPGIQTLQSPQLVQFNPQQEQQDIQNLGDKSTQIGQNDLGDTQQQPLYLDNGKGLKLLQSGDQQGLKPGEIRVRDISTDKGGNYIASSSDGQKYSFRPEVDNRISPISPSVPKLVKKQAPAPSDQAVAQPLPVNNPVLQNADQSPAGNSLADLRRNDDNIGQNVPTSAVSPSIADLRKQDDSQPAAYDPLTDPKNNPDLVKNLRDIDTQVNQQNTGNIGGFDENQQANYQKYLTANNLPDNADSVDKYKQTLNFQRNPKAGMQDLKTDDDVLSKGSAGSFDIPVDSIPQGVSVSRYIAEQGLKQAAPNYDITDAEINSELDAEASRHGGKYIFSGGKTVDDADIDKQIADGTKSIKFTPTLSQINNILNRRDGVTDGSINPALRHQLQMQGSLSNAGAADLSAIQKAGEERQQIGDEIKAEKQRLANPTIADGFQNALGVLTSPVSSTINAGEDLFSAVTNPPKYGQNAPETTDEEIDAEIKRREQNKQILEGIGTALANPVGGTGINNTVTGRLLGGFIGSLGKTAQFGAGLDRPLAALGITPDRNYKLLANLGKGGMIISESSTKESGQEGGFAANALNTIGALPVDTGRFIVVSTLTGGNVVLASAIDSAAISSGAGDDPNKVAQNLGKGGLFGAVLHGAGKFGEFVSSTLEKSIAEYVGKNVASGAITEEQGQLLKNLAKEKIEVERNGTDAEKQAFRLKEDKTLDYLSKSNTLNFNVNLMQHLYNRADPIKLISQVGGKIGSVSAVGAGSFLVAKAEGEDDEKAGRSALLQMGLDIAMHAKEIGEMGKLSGKVFREWQPDGTHKDVGFVVNEDGKVDAYDVTGKVPDEAVQGEVMPKDAAATDPNNPAYQKPKVRDYVTNPIKSIKQRAANIDAKKNTITFDGDFESPDETFVVPPELRPLSNEINTLAKESIDLEDKIYEGTNDFDDWTDEDDELVASRSDLVQKSRDLKDQIQEKNTDLYNKLKNYGAEPVAEKAEPKVEPEKETPPPAPAEVEKSPEKIIEPEKDEISQDTADVLDLKPKSIKQPSNEKAEQIAENPPSNEEIKPSASNENQPTGFKTEKGSVYSINGQSTARNKSFHPEHGPEDVGQKKPSDLTLYGDKNAVLSLGLGGIEPMEGAKHVISIKDNGDGTYKGQHVYFNPVTKQWINLSKNRNIDTTLTSTPEVGKHPLELWSKTTDNGQIGYTNSHAGNKITELFHETEPQEIAVGSDVTTPKGDGKVTQIKGQKVLINVGKDSPVMVKMPDVKLKTGENNELPSTTDNKNTDISDKSLSADKEDVPETKHEYSSTQIDVDPKTTKEIQDFSKKFIDEKDLTEEDGREENSHATAKFGLETNNAEDVRPLVEDMKPFTATLGKTFIFNTNPDFDVVNFEIHSPELNELNKRIAELPNHDSHPEFTPHVAIAYVKKGEGEKYAGNTEFEGKKIKFNGLTFSDKNREKVFIPFKGEEVSKSIPKLPVKTENKGTEVSQNKNSDTLEPKTPTNEPKSPVRQRVRNLAQTLFKPKNVEESTSEGQKLTPAEQAKQDKINKIAEKKPRAPQKADPTRHSLSTFVRLSGGIKPSTVLDTSPLKNARQGKFLLHSKGRHVEDAFRNAVEAGYFPDKTTEYSPYSQSVRGDAYNFTANDFIDAVADDANGSKKHYSAENDFANQIERELPIEDEKFDEVVRFGMFLKKPEITDILNKLEKNGELSDDDHQTFIDIGYYESDIPRHQLEAFLANAQSDVAESGNIQETTASEPERDSASNQGSQIYAENEIDDSDAGDDSFDFGENEKLPETATNNQPQSKKDITPEYAKSLGVEISPREIPEFLVEKYKENPNEFGEQIGETGWHIAKFSNGYMIYLPKTGKSFEFGLENRNSADVWKKAKELAEQYAEENKVALNENKANNFPTDLFGNEILPTHQEGLFGKSELNNLQNNKENSDHQELIDAYGQGTADYISKLEKSPDKDILRIARDLKDARDLVAAKGANAQQIIEDASDALDIFNRARQLKQSVDEFLSQPVLGGKAPSKYAENYAKAMETGTFSKVYKQDLSDVKTSSSPLKMIQSTNFVGNYEKGIDAFVDGTLPGHKALEVGEITPILDKLGMPARPIVLQQDVIRKTLEGKHKDKGITPEILKDVPKLLKQPIAVIESDNPNAPKGTLLVVTKRANEQGHFISIALQPNQRVHSINVNRIASIHPRDLELSFESWERKGQFRYLNKKMGLDLSDGYGDKFTALVQKILDPSKSVLTEADFVNKPLKKVRNAEDESTMDNLANEKYFDDILPNIDSKIDKDGAVELNPEAQELIRTLLAGIEDEDRNSQPILEGLFLDDEHLTHLTDAIDEFTQEAKENGLHTETLEKLLSDIKTAGEKNGTAILKVFDDTVPHEKVHQGSHVGAAEKGLETRYSNVRELATGDSAESDSFRTAFKNWVKGENRRWKIEKADDYQLGHAAEEIFTYLSDGDHEKLGLSVDEGTNLAVELGVRYIQSRKAENPNLSTREAFASFDDTVAAKYIDAIEEKENAERQRAEQRQETDAGDGGSDSGGRGRDLERNPGENESSGESSDTEANGREKESAAELAAASGPDSDGGEKPESGLDNFTPGGKAKFSNTPQTARANNIPIADRLYNSTTNLEQQEFADKQLDKGLEKAAEWFNNQIEDGNPQSGATTVVGINLMKKFGEEGNLTEMNKIADSLVPMLTEAGQAIQAMSLLSAHDPSSAGAYAASIKKRATGKDLSQEDIDKATQIATDLSETAKADGVGRALLETAQKELEAAKTEADNFKKALESAINGKDKIKIDLSEARKNIRNLKAQVERLKNAKPPKQKTAASSQLLKELQAKKPNLLDAIRAKYGKVSTGNDGNLALKMAKPVTSLDPDLVDWATLTLMENLPKGTMTPAEFKTELNNLTNNQLTPDEINDIHAAAIEQIKNSKPLTTEQKAIAKARNEHYREADLHNTRFEREQKRLTDEAAKQLRADEIEAAKAEKKRVADELKQAKADLREAQKAEKEAARADKKELQKSTREAQAEVNKLLAEQKKLDREELAGYHQDKITQSIIEEGVNNNHSDEAIFHALARKSLNPDDAIKSLKAEFPDLKPAEIRKAILDGDQITRAARDLVKTKSIQADNDYALTQKEVANIKEELRVNNLEKAKASRKATSFYNGLTKSKAQVAIETGVNFRKANLLTSIKRLFGDIASNTAFKGAEELANFPAAAADIFASAITGERSVEGINPKAIYQSIKTLVISDDVLKNLDKDSGIKTAYRILRYGDDADHLKNLQLSESTSGDKFGTVGKVADAYINFVFRSLSAGDALFKIMAYRRALEETARVQAINAHKADPSISIKEFKKNFLLNPTEAGQINAVEYAEFATFQNDNAISSGISRIKGTHYGVRAGIDTLIPFDRTPTNIVLRLLDYSPLGFLRAGKAIYDRQNPSFKKTQKFNAEYRPGVAKDLSSDEFDALPKAEQREIIADALNDIFKNKQQREFAKAFGRATTGTSLLALGGLLAAAGLLAGSMSPNPILGDKKEGEEFFKRSKAGVENGSILIPGKVRLTLPKDPSFNILTLGATLYEQESLARKEHKDPVGAAVDGVSSAMLDAVAEQPLVRTFADYFGRKQSAGARVGGVLSGFIPMSAMLKEIGEVGDPTAKRSSETPESRKQSWRAMEWSGFKNSIVSKVPVARNYYGDESDVGVSKDERGGPLRRLARFFDVFNMRSPAGYSVDNGITMPKKAVTPVEPKETDTNKSKSIPPLVRRK